MNYERLNLENRNRHDYPRVLHVRTRLLGSRDYIVTYFSVDARVGCARVILNGRLIARVLWTGWTQTRSCNGRLLNNFGEFFEFCFAYGKRKTSVLASVQERLVVRGKNTMIPGR